MLHPRTGERAKALSFQIDGDAAQHFGEIGPGAAARVEHVDVLRREAIRDAEIVLECLVHAGDHVADHFRRRVPDAQLLAQVGIEGFQERLVEVRHRFAFVEAGEEGHAVHPVERRRRPIQHFDEIQPLQPAGA